MVAERFTSYSIANDQEFTQALEKAAALIGDLTLPLSLIRGDFYKSERAIFQLQGPGQYPDLKESTKKEKERKGFKAYPILYRSGKLAKSLTNAGDPNAIGQIFNKQTLIIGTLVDYGIYHQSDRPRKKIPLRKFLFIGPEAAQFATSEQIGRMQRWMGIIADYVKKVLAKGGV